jgi:tetratricopeptide (TPR) repeat protein
LVLITLLAHLNTVSSISFDLRLLNACNSILLYLTKLLVPLNFAPLYPYLIEPGEAITWKSFLPVLGVLGLTFVCLIAWTRNRQEWLIAWLVYLVTIAPVLGLIQSGEQGAADRFAYFPTLPAYVLFGAGILIVLEKAAPIRKVLVLLSVFFLVLLLTDKTRQLINVWENPHTLWSYAVKQNPTNVTANYNLGITFLRQQNYEKAAFHFDQSVKLPSNPTSAVMAFPTLAFRGLSYIHLGRYNEALGDYVYLGDTLESSPHINLDRDCIYFNSGWLYSKLGIMDKAIENFEKVGRESQLWPDTVIWLETIKQDSNDTLAFENLPGFCTAVFP